jgi:hypothetical protein
VDQTLRLVFGPPPVVDYLRLRAESGRAKRRSIKPKPASAVSWAAIHVVHEPTGRRVGMGRVIGDGGWYFHVMDMAVLPAFQPRGIGTPSLERCWRRSEAEPPPALTSPYWRTRDAPSTDGSASLRADLTASGWCSSTHNRCSGGFGGHICNGDAVGGPSKATGVRSPEDGHV